MDILITGYKGMIGSRLYSYLKSIDTYKVDGLDIVDNTGDIRTVVASKHYDIIVHCAGLTSVVESIKHPEEYYDTNVLGTYNLVKQFPNSKFIFLSTSAIYGEGLLHSELSRLNPQSPYAQNKIDAEMCIYNHIKEFAILRLSNIYGGKKGERNVYQVFEEESILPIYGDGSSTRDYLHLDDLVKIIRRSFSAKGTFNIGSGQIKSVLEIAKEFNKPLKFLPAREGEINAISLNLGKAIAWGLIQ